MGEKIRNLIKEIVSEEVEKSQLSESHIYLSSNEIPEGIKRWVKAHSRKNIQKYKIHQDKQSVVINTPWHVSDRETYQFFKLIDGNAVPVGNDVERSGWESDSPQGFADGQTKEGKVDIPEGFILVCYGTYPERVEIYTGPGAQAFLPNNEINKDLSPTELIILWAARSLKSFARPKFKDEKYESLIQKGLLKNNRSITINGENLLQDPEIKEKIEKAKELFRQQTGRYL